MLSSLLNSDRAVQVNVEIMRAFVGLRQMLASSKKLEQKYSKQFKIVFDAIQQLMTPPDSKQKRTLGVIWDNEKLDQ